MIPKNPQILWIVRVDDCTFWTLYLLHLDHLWFASIPIKPPVSLDIESVNMLKLPLQNTTTTTLIHKASVGIISFTQWANFPFLGLSAPHYYLHMNSSHIFEASCLSNSSINNLVFLLSLWNLLMVLSMFPLLTHVTL